MKAPDDRPKLPARERAKELFAEYGVTAVVVHYGLAIPFFVAVLTAINLGWRPESTAGTAGSWGIAYLVYKGTMIPRVAVTAGVTPVVVRNLGRLRRTFPATFRLLDRLGERLGISDRKVSSSQGPPSSPEKSERRERSEP